MTTQLNFVLVLCWARPLLPEEDEDRGDVASSVKLQSAERRRRRRRSQKILHRVVSCCCCSSCPMIYESPALLLLLLSQSLSMLLLLSCNRAQQKNILWTLSPPGPSPACCCSSSWSWPNEAGSENKHLRGTHVAVASRRRSVRSLVRSFSHLLSLSPTLSC